MKSLVIDIVEGKKKYLSTMAVAENWNEVPVDVYPELCSIYLKKPDEMDVYDKTVRAFTLLTLPYYETIERLTAEELYELLKLVDWVFNKLDLTVNHLSQIDIDGIIFHGPSDGMENLRFAEWCVADTYFTNYAKSGNLLDLQNLAACVYRPAGEGSAFNSESSNYRGDIREKFNDQLLAKRQHLLGCYLSPAMLHGIYIFFASCKHQIIALYPEFFPPKKGTEETPVSSDQKFSWFDIYDDLRGDPKFGGPDKLEEEFLHTVLASIERSKITMKELKKKHKI